LCPCYILSQTNKPPGSAIADAFSAGFRAKTAPYGNPAGYAFFRSDVSVRLFSMAQRAGSWLNSPRTIFRLPGEKRER